MKVGMKPGNQCLPSEGIDDYECATCFDLSLRCVDCNGEPLMRSLKKRRAYLAGARKRAIGALGAGPSDVPRGVRVGAGGVLRAVGTFAWIVVGVVILSLAGCATFADSKATCLANVEGGKAIEMVVPHLAAAAVCASKHVEDEPAALACVTVEMEAFKAKVTPVVYQCALALVGDVVTAGKK